MAITVPLRHELKFYINPVEYQVLSRQLDRVLERDPNGDENNEYHIRSLYFDTIYNDALLDKLDGVKNRDKYRIRIYNFSDKFIRMECKTKVGSLISKRSVAIPKLLAEQIIAGDPSGPLAQTLHQYFPRNAVEQLGGQGYFSAYTRSLGFDSCLFEFPQDVYFYQDLYNSGYIEKYIDAIWALLETY